MVKSIVMDYEIYIYIYVCVKYTWINHGLKFKP